MCLLDSDWKTKAGVEMGTLWAALMLPTMTAWLSREGTAMLSSGNIKLQGVSFIYQEVVMDQHSSVPNLIRAGSAILVVRDCLTHQLPALRTGALGS